MRQKTLNCKSSKTVLKVHFVPLHHRTNMHRHVHAMLTHACPALTFNHHSHIVHKLVKSQITTSF